MKRLLLPLLAAIAVLLSLGCKRGPDVTGSWTFGLPPATMLLDFDGKGTYSGTMTSPYGPANVTGTYSVKGDILAMDPPTISGPGGSTVPSGGQMRLKMTPHGPNVIQLFDGKRNLVMTRRGPAP